MRFDGETYDHDRDGKRLSSEYGRVFALMCDGRWRTLADIEAVTHDSEAGISARLRDMRKKRFGAHTVEREYVANGVWQYRLRVYERQRPLL